MDAGSIKHNRMKVTGYGWGSTENKGGGTKAHRIVTDVAHDGQLSQLYLGLG